MAKNTAAEPAEAPTEQADQNAPDAVEVQDVELPEVAETQSDGPGGQVDIVLETIVPVSASLGQAEMEVRELLQLGPGSVIKVDRRVGEPVDLFLRGIKFASGSLVVVGEQLGVKIKEILPPADRAPQPPSA